jgi:serine/threonine-protein kinase
MTHSRVGSYDLVAELGAGAMGVVYEAEHRLLGRRVAIKTIRPEIAADQALIRRLVAEARAVATLEHPAIVRLYDFSFEGSSPYMVMELVKGRTLAELVQGGRRLQPAWVVNVLRPVAEALDHAHWNGVIHRDVKPANIVLADDGRVMVMDFGLAFLQQERVLTEPGSIVGTADYIAPEQVARESLQGTADVYSLAAVIFHAVTGRPPFLGTTWLDVAARRLREAPPPACAVVPELSEEFSQRLAVGLTRDPAKRTPTAVELLDQLEDALRAPSVWETEMAQRSQRRVEHSRFGTGFARRAAGALSYLRYP